MFSTRKTSIDTRQKASSFFPPVAHFCTKTTRKSDAISTRTAPMTSPCGIGLALFVCCSTVYYIPDLYDPGFNVQGFNCPFMCGLLIPPCEFAHHNRGPSIVADTTTDFFRPCSTYLLVIPLSNCVVITAVNLRHVTVLATSCVVLSLNTSACPN